MRIGRKVFIGLLVLVLGSPYIPEMSFAQVGSEEDEISRHTPEFRFSVEEDLPVNRTEGSGVPWVWVILGVL